MTTMRKVYLNAGDRTNINEVGCISDFDLSNSRLSCESNQQFRIAVSQVNLSSNQAASHATTEYASSPETAVVNAQSAVFGWNYSDGGGTPVVNKRYVLYCNNIRSDAPPTNSASLALTVQTTIEQVLAAMNQAMGKEVLVIDPLSAEIGQRRLVINVLRNPNDTVTIGGEDENQSLQNLSTALGVNNDQILINRASPTRNDFNMSLLLPVCYITSNLNTNTFCTREALSNVLCSVPLDLQLSTVPEFLDTIFSASGPVVFLRSMVWNYQPYLSEGSHKMIATKEINNISIQLRNSQGYVLYGGQNAYSLALEIQTVDAE